MSNDAPHFARLVPGFEFLQDLVKNAGAAMPGIGQWVAPTLNPEELEKRIGELRTVQYWLEQNVRMLGATIQALEVQRMTLSTLKTMNVQMGDLREALTAQMPGAAPTTAPASAPAAPRPFATGAPAAQKADATPPAVDPMQWWSALTQQFGQLAANALKDGAAAGAAVPAGAMGGAVPTPASAGASRAAGASAKARGPRRRAAAKP